MGQTKTLGATPMPAASISHECPMTKFERITVLQELWVGQPAGSLEESHKRKGLYEQLSRGWDWENKEQTTLHPANFEDLVDPAPVLTKAHYRALKEISEAIAAKSQGRTSFAMLDLADRVTFILTAG